MFEKIKNIYKKLFKTKVDKENKEDEDYIPSHLEMWRFYLKFIDVKYKKIILMNLFQFFNMFAEGRTLFIMLEFKNALAENDEEKLKYLVIEFISYNMISQFLQYFSTFDDSYKNNHASVQKSILRHLFSLDIQYYEDNKVTQISDIIKQGTTQISWEISDGQMIEKIRSFASIMTQVYFIYCQSPQLLITLTILSFIFNYFILLFSKKKEDKEKELDQESDYKDFAVDDILNNIQVIKTFGTEQKEINQIESMIEKNAIYQKDINYYRQLGQLIHSFSYDILKVSIILQIFFQLNLSESDNKVVKSLSELFDSSVGSMQLAELVLRMINKQPENYYNEGKKYIGKVMKLFEIKAKIDQDLDDNDSTQFDGNIAFQNVCFKYPIGNDLLALRLQKDKNKEKMNEKIENNESNIQENTELQTIDNSQQQMLVKSISQNQEAQFLEETKHLRKKNSEKCREYVLEDVSFSIKKGQLISFVGKSGCGKSTIIKLIQRYYDINSGNILFDNQNIKDVSLSKIRRSIGLVSQEPSLFDNDIEYNITYGCQDDNYTAQELKNICDISGVSEFVFDESRFPKGLKTLVGSKGTKLSGGQKQRIAIARALIKKPKILILDEATSSLDSESESIVQNYIDKLVGYKGMTIIVIAHRLSTVINSDVIYVMKHGQIKESGNHDQLIALNQIYAKLVHHQIHFQQQINNV